MIPNDPMTLVIVGFIAFGFIAAAVLAFRTGRGGRGVQAIGLALAIAGFYVSGLMTLLYDWAEEAVTGGDTLPLIGIGGLVVGVLVWIVGGWVATKQRDARLRSPGTEGNKPALGGPPKPVQQPPSAPPAGDKELDEIEALLKSRGIQ